MWNFSGKQNDIQGHGELNNGNWISGINFIDEYRLGPQITAPPNTVPERITMSSAIPWTAAPKHGPTTASLTSHAIGPPMLLPSPITIDSSHSGTRRLREEDYIPPPFRRRTDNPDVTMSTTGTLRKREDYDGDDVQYTPSQPPGPPPPSAPKAKAIPILAIPLDRFFVSVTSATTAVAVEILPPIIPPIKRAKIKRVKDPEKNHNR